jgi:ketosteroid isomerase-like protein
MRRCLPALGSRQQRYLKLRAGFGRGRALTRAAAADRVRLPRRHARRFERRALAGLRQACTSTLASRERAYVGRLGTPTAAVMTTSAGTVDTPPKGTRAVLAAKRSSPESSAPGSDGSPAERGAAVPAIAPPPEPGTGFPVAVWLAAALAALAALAGAGIVRGRWRLHLASAAIAEMPGFAGAPEPVGNPADVVRQAFASLSDGDVSAASALVHPDVRWPGLGRGTLEGRSQFERYWAERLGHVKVDIEPVRFERRNGELVTEVNELIQDRDRETTIGEYHAIRRFTFRDGLVAEMKRGRS